MMKLAVIDDDGNVYEIGQLCEDGEACRDDDCEHDYHVKLPCPAHKGTEVEATHWLEARDKTQLKGGAR